MRFAPAALLAILALGACDPFPQVRKEDTIEAYEAYLAEHPDSNYAIEARGRLETLMFEKAQKEQSLAAYDAYLERFPKGIYREKAYEQREQYLWAWAEETHTPEGWDRYLEEYSQFDAKKVRKARKRREAAAHKDQIGLGEPKAERVNLAEDPEGPKNGWLFTADITNNTDRTLTYLQITARYRDAEGKVVGEGKWPVVSSRFAVPVEPEKTEPMKPGETRTWELMTGDVPESFAETVTLVPTSLKFEELAP
jgi:hypothetical protein